MRFLRYMAIAAVGASLAACDLAVTNVNNPDRQRILASPAEVEALASAQFQQILSATHTNFNNVGTMMATASFMNTSSLANSGMGPRSSIPRGQIDNSVGNAYQGENFRDFRLLSGVARNAADILIAMNTEGFTLGPNTHAQELRLRAFTHFVKGLAYGFIALAYDSTGIARVTDEPGFEPPLEGYQDVATYAISQLDSAIVISQRAPGMSTIPGGAGAWLTGPGGPDVTAERFRQIVRSYRAQIRSDVARNPTERAAVNWAAVRDDALAGIDADFLVHMNPSDGWVYDWMRSVYHFRDANWHQMNYYIIGMADVSGAYSDWLAEHRDTRSYFTIVTPDERFPQGATRADQLRPASEDDDPLPAGQYFRNRNPDKDEGTTTWRASQYDHFRFKAHADASNIGPYPLMTTAQVRLMAAEAHIRLGANADAVTLINVTREGNGGLPAVTAAGVPSAADCVPQVPAGTAPDAGTRCGNLMEAMMWEKWLETAFTGYGAWFFDNRGWGVLPEGTAVHWPVPNQELDARDLPVYSLGGVGDATDGSPPSIYGFGAGPK